MSRYMMKKTVKASMRNHLRFMTMKDSDTKMNPLEIRKYALCTNGIALSDGSQNEITVMTTKTSNQLALGELYGICRKPSLSFSRVCFYYLFMSSYTFHIYIYIVG
jgi:hypothetical protein